MKKETIIELLRNLSAIEGFVYNVENAREFSDGYIKPSVDILVEALKNE